MSSRRAPAAALARAASTLVIIGFVLEASVPPPRDEIRGLSLYEKTGRAPLVVFGEVAEAEHRRFALIRCLDVVKAAIPEKPGATFRIAYKLDSFLRRPWQDRIAFEDGERVLLFLRRFTKEDGESPEADLYTLMWGAEGKIVLPPEGEKALVEAARTFAGILAETDPDRQAQSLSREIASGNPFVSDGAFEEMLKQGLGGPEMIPALVDYFSAAREPTRLLSMRLLRRILSDARAANQPVPGREDLADRIRARALADASAEIRVEAVRTLAVLGGEGVRAFLQRLAKEDPSQLVRYEATKSIADH